MTPARRCRTLALSLLAPLLWLACFEPALAQGFPNRPIRFIVPFPAAGPTDMSARLVAEQMSKTLGQSVVVENRAGANGIVGLEALAKSPADGYTIAIAPFPTLVFNPLLYSKLPYSPSRDFAPVILLVRQAYVLIAGARLPATSLAGVLALARAKPDGLFYGSYGAGSVPHVAMEMLQRRAGVKLVHVPYSGNPAVMTALFAGDVQLLFSPPDPVAEAVKAGKLRAIATAAPRRTALLPSTPTFAEAGMADFDASTWSAIVAPAGTPSDVLGTLNQAMDAALETAALKSRFAVAGIEPAGGSAAEAARFINAENERWGRVIGTMGVKLD